MDQISPRLSSGSEGNSDRPQALSQSSSSSTSTLCPVGDLIDLGSSMTDLTAPQPPPQPFHRATTPRRSRRSGSTRVVNLMDRRCSAEVMSETETSFEGVANGELSGTNSLHDSGHASDSAASRAYSLTPNPMRRPGGSNTLYGRSTYSNGSRRSSFNSDLDMYSASDAEIHSELTEISSQVKNIQSQLNSIGDHSGMDEKHVRLKQDNAVLQERISILEDQLTAAEERWRERLVDERARGKELQARIEREKDLEAEAARLKLQLLDREHSECLAERTKLNSEVEKLRGAKESLEERVEDLEDQISRLAEDHSEAAGELRTSKRDVEAALQQREDTIAELTLRLEEFTQHSTAQRQTSNREEELEEAVAELRAQRTELEGQLEELKAEVLTAAVGQGRSLLGAAGPSLAQEMDSMSKDQVELMNALKEQEMTNQKLRAYVDGILLRVIEMHPAILEVQSGPTPPP